MMQKTKTMIVSMMMSLLIISSCSKDSGSTGTGSSGAIKVTFKVIGSPGIDIKTVVYTYGTKNETFTSVSGESWTKDITVPASTPSVNLGVNAIGKDASSTMKAQIYVNGTLMQEGNSTGTILSATATHLFN